MNTDKLIPLDFSRNITPFVMGEKLLNAESGLVFEIDCKSQLAEFNKFDPTDEGVYYVISYADRENKGTQPVGDDVRVDVNFDDAFYDNVKASNLIWPEDDERTTSHGMWKPNHASALKQYQESQLKKESARMDNVILNGNNGEHYEQEDNVKSPSHYQLMSGVESIEIIARSMTADMWKGFCLGNIIKYRLRAGKKDTLEQDIAKADYYSELFDMHRDKCIY